MCYQVNGVVEVLRLERRGPTAVHFTDEPIEAGAEVEIEVDWERRFDHMQQHSGEGGPLVKTHTHLHSHTLTCFSSAASYNSTS